MTGPAAYALFQILALLTMLALRRPSPLPPRQRAVVVAGAILGAAIGAKLPFVLFAGESPLTLDIWIRDGKTILSGLAGGYLGVEAAKAMAGINAKTGDGFAVPLAAAVAVGRVGCFFNGCCSAPGLAVPLFESAFHAAMAFLLWRLERLGRFRWQLLKLYLIAYAAFRFLIEFVRVEPRILAGLTAYQLGAATLSLLMVALWMKDKRLKRGLSAEDAARA
jgi:phosphatidylglycerol---prolipoprotein diacylglyceryl transferase